MKSIKVIITGGGSGGHLFPGIALADHLMNLNSKTKIIFVGSKTKLEKQILKETPYKHICILKNNFKAKKSRLMSLIQILGSLFIAKNILKSFKPNLIISIGGYSSVPISIISKLKRIPIVVCEQNILPGLTNRFLFRIADKIYTSFKNTIGLKVNSKIIFSGNPLRKEVINANKVKERMPINYEFKKKFTILILGGSQGAHAINIAVINSLKYFNSNDNLKFIHQTGINDEDKVKKQYINKNIDAIVSSFFINMGTYYSKADLVICRAGATTIAELTAIGKSSILIPYPFAKNNHQLLNAQNIANVGGAKIIFQKDLSGFKLAQHIKRFIKNPIKISQMAKKAKLIGISNSSEIIISDVYKMLEQKRCI